MKPITKNINEIHSSVARRTWTLLTGRSFLRLLTSAGKLTLSVRRLNATAGFDVFSALPQYWDWSIPLDFPCYPCVRQLCWSLRLTIWWFYDSPRKSVKSISPWHAVRDSLKFGHNSDKVFPPNFRLLLPCESTRTPGWDKVVLVKRFESDDRGISNDYLQHLQE